MFASNDGLSDIHEWSKLAAGWLKPKGLCLFEIGSTQGKDSVRIFEPNFANVKTLKDYAGHDRLIFAENKKGSE